MTATLTAQGLTALLDPPNVFQLWHRATKRERWCRVAVGLHRDCVQRISGRGEWWLKATTDDEADLGLFAGCDAT